MWKQVFYSVIFVQVSYIRYVWNSMESFVCLSDSFHLWFVFTNISKQRQVNNSCVKINVDFGYHILLRFVCLMYDRDHPFALYKSMHSVDLCANSWLASNKHNKTNSLAIEESGRIWFLFLCSLEAVNSLTQKEKTFLSFAFFCLHGLTKHSHIATK